METGIGIKWRTKNEPEVYQCQIGKFEISWNPDDNRFHVSDSDQITQATFACNKKGFANAVYWARQRIK